MLGKPPAEPKMVHQPGPRVNSRDAMLDKINQLVRKRESTLKQMEAWEVTDPTLKAVLDDLRVHLL